MKARLIFGLFILAIAAFASGDELSDAIDRVRRSEGKATSYELDRLRAFGSRAVPGLIELSNEPKRSIAFWSLQELTYIRDPRVLPALSNLLKRREDKATIMLAIGNHGNPRGAALARQYLADRKVRFAATYALGRIGAKADIALLKPLLKDKDKGIRWQAAQSIKWIESIERKFPNRLAHPKAWWGG